MIGLKNDRPFTFYPSHARLLGAIDLLDQAFRDENLSDPVFRIVAGSIPLNLRPYTIEDIELIKKFAAKRGIDEVVNGSFVGVFT